MHLREEQKVPNQIQDANRPQLLLSQQSISQEEHKIDKPKNPAPKPLVKINKLNLQKIKNNERAAQPQSDFIME